MTITFSITERQRPQAPNRPEEGDRPACLQAGGAVKTEGRRDDSAPRAGRESERTRPHLSDT